MSARKTIFLTGVTGTLGKEIVKKLLITTDDHLYLLIRRKNRFTHWDRVRKILAEMGLEIFLGTRVQVMEGDITRPGFGLEPHDLEILQREVTEFYHIAALTALNGSEAECMRINVGGTEEALKLAWQFRKSGCLERFFYFSTAYVSGSLRRFTALEDELPEQPYHANFYESSKYRAESKVREAMHAGLPVTIFRPSIVVGHSQTGAVSEFNVIYPFMKLFVHGLLSKLPTRLENSFNIVPIDFVVDAALAIARQENSVGRTFHLVTQQPPTMETLLELKEAEYPEIPDFEILDPDTFSKEALASNEQFVYEMLAPYLGYLNGLLGFDTTNTEKALEGTGVKFPKTDYDFCRTIFQYAVNSGYLIVPQKA
ncbi:MAG: SDR family oxidoreductase [Candidatus Omnitrophica bacterium]|nr:SDR family oxidoreductase [Candidatus Omnitrophota bacterium]